MWSQMAATSEIEPTSYFWILIGWSPRPAVLRRLFTRPTAPQLRLFRNLALDQTSRHDIETTYVMLLELMFAVVLRAQIPAPHGDQPRGST